MYPYIDKKKDKEKKWGRTDPGKKLIRAHGSRTKVN